MTAGDWFEDPEERVVVIKRAFDFVGMILAIAIFLAVAVAGGVMIAVPVPILLHFLSQYGGVTGTAAMMICRLAGVVVLCLALWAAFGRWRDFVKSRRRGQRPACPSDAMRNARRLDHFGPRYGWRSVQ